MPLLLRKNDAFVKHHANQGLTLLLFNALVTLAEEFVPFGGLLSLAGGLFSLVCVIRGILSVVNGRMDKLPLLGDIRYGSKDPGCSAALWSYRLAFTHPVTKKAVDVMLPPPQQYPWDLFQTEELA